MVLDCRNCKYFRVREEIELGQEDLAFNCEIKNINKNDMRGCVQYEDKKS